MAIISTVNPAVTLPKDDNYFPILDDLPACDEYEPGFYFGLRITTTAEQDDVGVYYIDAEGCPQPLFVNEVSGRRPLIACLSQLNTDLAVTTDAIGPIPMAIRGNIIDAGIVVDSAPTGANILVDVNKNGSTIFGAQKLQIDAGETKSQSASATAVINVSAVTQFDILTFGIDQVGSTNAGQNLRIFLLIQQLQSS